MCMAIMSIGGESTLSLGGGGGGGAEKLSKWPIIASIE